MAVMRTTRLLTIRRLTAALATTAAAAALGAGAALPAHAAPAEATVPHADSPTAVPGSYIVTLKKSAGLKAASAAGKGLISEYGGSVKRTFGTVLNGYAAKLTAVQTRRLAADPAVALVEQDQKAWRRPWRAPW